MKVMVVSRTDSKLEDKMVRKWENLRRWLEMDGNGWKKYTNWTLTRSNQRQDLN